MSDKAQSAPAEGKIESIKEEKPRVPTFPEFWAGMNEKANIIAQNNLQYLITANEFTYDGVTYKAKMINRKNMAQLKKLIDEGTKIDSEEQFDEYSQNIKQRACVLIEDMTPDKFEQGDYGVLENLVIAWGMKPRGFRNLQQGT